MEKKMSETVTGYIDHIIFRNEDNGYTVMVLKGIEDEDELTCVGSFPVVTQGASVELEGNFTQHPVYGKQFQASRLTEKMPEDALAMERYLGSGAIKGIGAALAARSVRRLNRTIQITDTGIHPGSGVGNHRNGLTEENLQVKVIGIGVPTVVDAATIVHDSMAHLLDTLEETEQKEFLDEMIAPNLYSMFVTPKDVDETVKYLSFTISEGLNMAFGEV